MKKKIRKISIMVWFQSSINLQSKTICLIHIIHKNHGNNDIFNPKWSERIWGLITSTLYNYAHGDVIVSKQYQYTFPFYKKMLLSLGNYNIESLHLLFTCTKYYYNES